jgi:hypothetical protein
MKRLMAWWRAHRIRALHYKARCAAANYMAAKARYENALAISENAQ